MIKFQIHFFSLEFLPSSLIVENLIIFFNYNFSYRFQVNHSTVARQCWRFPWQPGRTTSLVASAEDVVAHVEEAVVDMAETVVVVAIATAEDSVAVAEDHVVAAAAAEEVHLPVEIATVIGLWAIIRLYVSNHFAILVIAMFRAGWLDCSNLFLLKVQPVMETGVARNLRVVTWTFLGVQSVIAAKLHDLIWPVATRVVDHPITVGAFGLHIPNWILDSFNIEQSFITPVSNTSRIYLAELLIIRFDS